MLVIPNSLVFTAYFQKWTSGVRYIGTPDNIRRLRHVVVVVVVVVIVIVVVVVVVVVLPLPLLFWLARNSQAVMLTIGQLSFKIQVNI